MNIAMGWNVDNKVIRAHVIETMKTNANMQKQLAVGYTMPGMVSGTSEAEQWEIVSDYLKANSKK